MRSYVNAAKALLPMVACALAGCGHRSEPASAGPEVTIDTVQGVPVTRNGRMGLWRERMAWTVEVEWRIGEREGPEEVMFGSPLTAVSLGPHGQVFVLDRISSEIRVFDGNGRFLRRFGGAGQGPRELSKPTSLVWDRLGRLWVPESFIGRYTVFDSLGNYVKTHRRPMRSRPDPVFEVVGEASGALLDLAPRAEDLAVVRVDTAGPGVDTLAAIPYPETPASLMGILMVNLPESVQEAIRRFRPHLLWHLAPDGTIWFSVASEYRLVHMSTGGDTLRIVETSHRSVSFTSAEEDLVDRACYDSRGGLSREDFRKRVISDILPMDDGYVLVQVEGEENKPTSLLDVFDPAGRFLGTMDAGFPLEPRAVHALKGDTLIAVSVDELDVPFIVRATIHRDAEEKGASDP